LNLFNKNVIIESIENDNEISITNK